MLPLKYPFLFLQSFLFITLIGIAQPALTAEPYVLSVQQLQEGLKKSPTPSQKGFVLVDVRSTEEHQGGVIPGTDFNIDFRDMKQRYRELGVSTDDHIVVYCQTGHRSNIAANTLTELGFTHVYNVEGSMNAWQAAGYPIEQVRR